MKGDDARLVTWLLWMAAAACWVVSLLTPVFQTSDGSTIHGIPNDGTSTYGFQVLVIGWMSLFFLVPAWLANIILFPVLIGWNRFSPRSLRKYAVIASMLSFTWFVFPARGGFPTDGGPLEIQRFQVGMYLWLASFILAAIGAHMRLALEKDDWE